MSLNTCGRQRHQCVYTNGSITVNPPGWGGGGGGQVMESYVCVHGGQRWALKEGGFFVHISNQGPGKLDFLQR